jgi:hypothetical protein
MNQKKSAKIQENIEISDSNPETSPIKRSFSKLEDIIGFAWLGVLASGVLAGTGYFVYDTLKKTPQLAEEVYNLSSNLYEQLSPYLDPIINS